MKHSNRLNTKIESGIMMKSLIISLIGFMLIFAVLPSYDSFADKPDDVGKSKYSISVEEITIPAQAKLPDGRIAEKVVHIFYEEGFSMKRDLLTNPIMQKGEVLLTKVVKAVVTNASQF